MEGLILPKVEPQLATEAEELRYYRLLNFLIVSKIQKFDFNVLDYEYANWRQPVDLDIEEKRMRFYTNDATYQRLCHPRFNIVALTRHRFNQFVHGQRRYEIQSSHIFAFMISTAARQALDVCKQFPIVRFKPGRSEGSIAFFNEPDAILFAAFISNEADVRTKRLMLA